MVTLNCADTVEKSILSVINQTYDNIEFIIIDGRSSDNTTNIIEKYISKIDYYISEKDGGIYDAMNKGIRAANGDWLYFLGADDEIYKQTTIEDIFSNGTCYEKYVMIFGEVIYSNRVRFVSHLNFKTNLINTVHHQSAFYSINLFSVFLYNISFKIVADYELNYRVYISGQLTKKVNIIVSKFSNKGLSMNWSHAEIIDMKLIRSHYINLISNNIYYYIALLNYYRRYYLS